MKTLLIGTLAVALAAAIILLSPAPVLAQQMPANICGSNHCWIQEGGPPVILYPINCAWTPWPGIQPPSAQYGTCSCPAPNPYTNPCPNYSNPY
jgi:hypothetical protein